MPEGIPPSQAASAISEMVSRIVANFHPEKIILFGSFARGAATKDSDVDLAVIFPELKGRRIDKAVEIGVALHGAGIAKDVIVLTSQDYAEQKDFVGTLGHILAKEGKVLYSRA